MLVTNTKKFLSFIYQILLFTLVVTPMINLVRVKVHCMSTGPERSITSNQIIHITGLNSRPHDDLINNITKQVVFTFKIHL
jgi:hypothetical protein